MSQFTQDRINGGFGSPRITWAVQRLILANIIIFALQLLSDPILVAFNINPGFYGGGFSAWLGFHQPRFLHGFLWMPFTYQFLHSGLMHLFMNMLWLFFFGPDVERVLGTRSFFRFYIICGAGAVLATLLPYFLLDNYTTNVVGASGAVMAVLVAFAMVEPDRQFFMFPFPWPINARALVIIVFVMNVIYSLGDTPISVITHFGGMGMGFLYMKALPLFLNYQRKKRRAGGRKKKNNPNDKVGEAVDNIFKFDDRKRR